MAEGVGARKLRASSGVLRFMSTSSKRLVEATQNFSSVSAVLMTD